MSTACVNYLRTSDLSSTAPIFVETKQIHEILLSIGIPPNLLGYRYLIYGIELLLMDSDYMQHITTRLYIDIASKFNTTPSGVERAMRHAMNAAWLHGNLPFINCVFKNCINPEKGVPTNSLFLSRIYYYLANAEYR